LRLGKRVNQRRRKGSSSSSRRVGESRQYLRDFNRLNQTTSIARELYDAMLEIYRNRANPTSLKGDKS
jgi:hypothetical protein